MDDYFKHLLNAAGTELQLFLPDAQGASFQATSGPPQGQLLAHHALIAAALASAKTATVEQVERVLTEVR